MNKLFAFVMIVALMGCTDTLDKKVADQQKQQQQQADYCKANPGVCERYCQDFPLEKTCPK